MAGFSLPTPEKLDDLLSVIDHCSPPEEAEYAHQHIQEARTYLLGAMPMEFACVLELARCTLERMNDDQARRTAKKMLDGLCRN